MVLSFQVLRLQVCAALLAAQHLPNCVLRQVSLSELTTHLLQPLCADALFFFF